MKKHTIYTLFKEYNSPPCFDYVGVLVKKTRLQPTIIIKNYLAIKCVIYYSYDRVDIKIRRIFTPYK